MTSEKPLLSPLFNKTIRTLSIRIENSFSLGSAPGLSNLREKKSFLNDVIDTNKRDTLKVIALSTAATAVPVGSLVAIIKKRKEPLRLGINISYETGSNHGTVALVNPIDQDVIVDVEFEREVNVPGGSLDVKQLMVVGPLFIRGSSSRRYQLPKLARRQVPFESTEGYRHGDQGFPITDNVVIANAYVRSDNPALNGVTPVFLSKQV